MVRVRRVLLTLALVTASMIVVVNLRPGGPGPDQAAGPVILLVRLRLGCKVPVLF
jgi:hypothetical protein